MKEQKPGVVWASKLRFGRNSGSASEALNEISKETTKQGQVLVDDVTRKAEDVTEQAGAALQQIESKAGDVAKDLGQKAKHVAEEATDQVKGVLNQ